LTVAAPLNRQPNGLLEFFGIKNGGENPQQLGQILQPQLDVLPLYENTAAAVVGSVTNNVAAGAVLFGPAGATSEPGDTWHFRTVGLYMNTVAVGAAAYMRLGAYFSGTFVPFTGTIYGNQAVGTLPIQHSIFARDIWLPPGWSLAYECSGLAGVPTFVASWWAYRYRW